MLERHDVDQGCSAVPLVIHAVGRANTTSEPVPRQDLLSIKKLKAEGTPSETMTVLGWVLDARNFAISLPKHKQIAWKQSVDVALRRRRIDQKSLDAIVGRLNHVGCIVPQARHFLSRLRSLLNLSRKLNWVTLSLVCEDDLRLWLEFIDQAAAGISINLITYRQPSRILRSDACEHGVGGYSLCSGVGWRWEIPIHLQNRASLNFLEHAASYVAVEVEHHHCPIPPLSCALSQVDSASADGWLDKSNFEEESLPCHFELSRRLARRCIDLKIKSCSQWFPGKQNDVADSLSRDHHLSDYVLTQLFSHSVPTQLPPNFVIKQVPSAMSCWLTALLQQQPPATVSPKQPIRSILSRGLIGNVASLPSAPKTIGSLTTLNPSNDPKFLAPLPSLSEIEDSPLVKDLLLSVEQSKPHWTRWQRPSGRDAH